MKKILSFTILLGTLLFAATSCTNEEELLFDGSAAERLNQASETYAKSVVAAENGWAMEYYPQASTSEDNPVVGVGYLMLAKFNNDHTVNVGAINSYTGGVYKEDQSIWEVITDMSAVLSFNSHNDILHNFSDPEDISNTSDDETGRGFEGDYEFIITEAPESGEYITLKGKKSGAYTRMTRLDEPTDFEEYITDVTAFKNKYFSGSTPNHDIITTGGEKFNMIMAQNGGSLGLTKYWAYDTDSTFTKVLDPMMVTRHGTKESGYTYNVRFRSSISSADDADKEFVYDAANDIFRGVNNSENVIEGEEIMPFFQTVMSAKHPYVLDRKNGQMSDQVKSVVDGIYSTYRNINAKYGINSYSILGDGEGNIILKCRYNQNDAKTELQYKYTQTVDGNTIKLDYVGPVSDTAEKHLSRVSGIVQDIFAQSFTITALETQMNLSTLKMTSTSNPDIWFEIDY